MDHVSSNKNCFFYRSNKFVLIKQGISPEKKYWFSSYQTRKLVSIIVCQHRDCFRKLTCAFSMATSLRHRIGERQPLWLSSKNCGSKLRCTSRKLTLHWASLLVICWNQSTISVLCIGCRFRTHWVLLSNSIVLGVWNLST